MTARYLTISLLFGLLLVGCVRKPNIKPEQSLDQIWGTNHGSLSATNEAPSGTFSGKLNTVWEHTFGGKPEASLALIGDWLVLPDSRKKVLFYGRSDGNLESRIRLKGAPRSGLAFQDSSLYWVAGRRTQELEAFDLRQGKTVWKVRVKPGGPSPIIVNNRLIMSSAENRLIARNLADGSVAWNVEFDDLPQAGPSFGHDLLFVPAGRDGLIVLDAETGEESFRIKTRGSCVTAPCVGRHTVYVADLAGFIYAVRIDDQRVVWDASTGGPVWSTPAYGGGIVVATNSNGFAVAVDSETGKEIWRFDADEVLRASPIIVNSTVIVASMAGKVFAINIEDGSVVDEVEVTGAVEQTPVSDGDHVYVVTQRGRIVCFGDAHESLSHSGEGNNP